jgi:hypothetical protein
MERPVRNLGNQISQICKLIEVCGNCGVSELRFENLHVIFNNNKTVDMEIPATIGIAPENNVKEIEKSEQDIREDQLAMALIENPAEYERLITAGELEDAENNH